MVAGREKKRKKKGGSGVATGNDWVGRRDERRSLFFCFWCVCAISASSPLNWGEIVGSSCLPLNRSCPRAKLSLFGVDRLDTWGSKAVPSGICARLSNYVVVIRRKLDGIGLMAEVHSVAAVWLLSFLAHFMFLCLT